MKIKQFIIFYFSLDTYISNFIWAFYSCMQHLQINVYVGHRYLQCQGPNDIHLIAIARSIYIFARTPTSLLQLSLYSSRELRFQLLSMINLIDHNGSQSGCSLSQPFDSNDFSLSQEFCYSLDNVGQPTNVKCLETESYAAKF